MFRNKRNYNTIQIILSWSKHRRPFWIMAIPLSPSSSHPGGTKATTATALPHISYSSGWLAWVASIQTSPVKLWSALNQLRTKQGWWVYSSVVKWGQTVDAQCSRGVGPILQTIRHEIDMLSMPFHKDAHHWRTISSSSRLQLVGHEMSYTLEEGVHDNRLYYLPLLLYIINIYAIILYTLYVIQVCLSDANKAMYLLT